MWLVLPRTPRREGATGRQLPALLSPASASTFQPVCSVIPGLIEAH